MHVNSFTIPTLCYTITLLKYVFFHSECIIMSSAHMIQHLREYSKHCVHLPCCMRQSDPPSIITRRQCLCSPETQQDLADVAIYTPVYWLQLSLLHAKTRDLRLCHLWLQQSLNHKAYQISTRPHRLKLVSSLTLPSITVTYMANLRVLRVPTPPPPLHHPTTPPPLRWLLKLFLPTSLMTDVIFQKDHKVNQRWCLHF